MITMFTFFLPATPETEEHSKAEAATSDHLEPSDSRNIKETVSRLPLLVALNCFCCALLVEKTQYTLSNFTTFSIALFLLARTFAIVGISRLRQGSQEPDWLSSSEDVTARYIGVLSMPVLALITLLLVITRPGSEMSSAGLLAHAMAQAASWAATIHLARLQLTNTSANMGTIAQSVQVTIMGLDFWLIVSALISLMISVAQSMLVLRPSAAGRRSIYFLALTFVLVFWLHEDPRLTVSSLPPISAHFISGHPIENLIRKNRAHFEAMSTRQSRTLKEATREYRRRYTREPPLGFDQWFELAKAHDFVLIDEFDTFMQSLEPFHGVHPSILQKRIDKAVELESGRLGVISFQDKNVTMSEGIFGLATRLMNDTWTSIVPYNMTVLVNEWDESMVSVPFDEVSRAVRDAKDLDFSKRKADSSPVNALPLIETGKQNGWAATAPACSINSPSRQDQCPEPKLSAPLPFIGNASFAKDVCQNCQILHNHGLLLAPGNMKVAHELVPIWSASKPSHFHDILYPSAYYIAVRDNYKPQLDSHWDEKDNKFYWVGTATGGWATPETWPLMQRQRLVLRTNKTNTDPVQYLAESAPGKWQPRFSTMAEVSELFTTRIAGVVQCDDEACEEENEAFGLTTDAPKDPQEAAYAHRFVMDIDGNGFSGRYYRLLQSRSVVVKSTVLKEWHDDRLVSWVHYVPLSTSYTELPEMARFLAGTKRGLYLSERIARESTQWHNEALRDVDLRLVWLRMLLEFGRVMQPELTM